MLAAAAQPSSYYFPLGRTQVRGGRAGEKKTACKQIFVLHPFKRLLVSEDFSCGKFCGQSLHAFDHVLH